MPYRVVPGGSTVAADMRSNVHPIHAEARTLRGVIEGELAADGLPDFDAPYRVELELPADSLKTGKQLEDREMSRRMDPRRYPVIQATVKKAWRVDESGRCRASIEVRALGRSQLIEEDFTVSAGDGRLTIEGEHVFDMRSFGVNPPRVLVLKMEPDVRVRVRIVAQDDAQAAGSGQPPPA